MIRPYEERDLEQLLDAWYSASKVAHPFLTDEFFEKERRAIAEVHMPAAETWVYELDGRVVGFIALLENEVGGIFVEAPLHGRGIGRALMDHARSVRGGELVLDVMKENRIGRVFYERYGFTAVQEHIHEETGHTVIRMEYSGPTAE